MPVAASKAYQTPSFVATETIAVRLAADLAVVDERRLGDVVLPLVVAAISCCHHFSFPVARSTAISEAARGLLPGRSDGK